MSWTRFLLHDYWTAREFNKLEKDRRQSGRSRRRQNRELRQQQAAMADRVEELEQNLEESTLLLRTLAELCVEKGVLTAAEVAAKAEQLDALDGVIDGRLGQPADSEDDG